MRINRCPWCSKKIDRRSDRYPKRRTTLGSRYTRFSRCQHCHNFYGQRLSAKWILLYILIFISSMILLSMLVQEMAYYAVFPFVIITAAWIFLRPFQRMDENENPISLDMPIFKAVIIANPPADKKVKKNTLYFLSDDFDKHDSFHTVSPIFVHTINYKTEELSFSFVYDHPLNQEYIKHKAIALYDSKMLLAAEIKTLNNEK